MDGVRGDILDSLDDVGYDGPLLEEAAFQQAVEGGPSSTEFTALISWMADGLNKLSGVEANVSVTSSADEAESFELELSGLLSELNCPYGALTQGEMVNRFGNKQNRLCLLDFLTSELQAAKMIACRPQKVEAMEVDKECGWHVSSKHLRNICRGLKISKPPTGVSEVQLFNKMEEKLRTHLGKLGPQGLGKPILKKKLSEQQWAKLGKINERMRKEYTLRRQMLIKRLDVTIQSFQWGERVKGKLQNDLAAAYRPKRNKLAADSPVTIATLMAAREDVAKLRKTSSGAVRKNTKSAINKVIMGHVPDRGGRPLEATPPVEMPSFQRRTEQAKGQRPQSGRGDRVQGGWSGGGRGGGGGGGRGGGRGGGGGGGGGGGRGRGGGGGGGWNQGDQSTSGRYQVSNQGGNQGGGGYQGGGGAGYQGGGGGYQGGGGAGYQGGGGAGYQGGGSGYQGGGSGYQGGGGGYQGGGGAGYQRGGGGYQGDGRGKRGGRR